MSAPHFSLLPHRSVIAVGGADRVEFLQGLISNDTTKVAPGRAIWAALLTPQGRFLNDMFVADGGDGHAAARNRARARAGAGQEAHPLQAALQGDGRGSKCGMEVAVVFGAGAEKRCRSTARSPSSIPGSPSSACACWRRPERPPPLLSARGIAAAPLDDYDALRLSLGVPDGSRDLPVEKALLLESGFDELNGVDWKKGCYMGQELTARTKYRALVRKRLFPGEDRGRAAGARHGRCNWMARKWANCARARANAPSPCCAWMPPAAAAR